MLRMGTPEEFATLREFFERAGHTEAAIRDRLGIETLSQARTIRSNAPADDALECVLKLFLLGEVVSPEEIRAHLRPGDMELLRGFGLIAPVQGGIIATVELYPVGGIHIASDRNREPEMREPGSPKVFSAISPQTEDFLAMLPQTRCPALLDLGSGTGAAALLAARSYAVQAFAFDLSPRSTAFAEFNARLNGIRNVTARQGDLYAPAGKRTFERIVAHPPYVPSLRSTEMLRDGGAAGEDITRRVVEGLPNYLRPGGRLYCLAMLAELAGMPTVERVRAWFREASSEFDVIAIARARVDAARFVFDNWSPASAREGDMALWQNSFRRQRIESFVYTALIIERHADARTALTVVRESGGIYQPEEVEAQIEWDLGGSTADIWAMRPVSRVGIQAVAVQRLENGEWSPEALRFSTAAPLRGERSGPRWIAELLARCDGTQTCREHQARMGVAESEFESRIRELAGAGLVRMK